VSTASAINGAVNGKRSTASSRASTPGPKTAPVVKSLASNTITEHVRFKKDQLQNPNAKDYAAVVEKITRLSGVEKIAVQRMKVSEVVTFSITGTRENILKARNRLLNEVGVKVRFPLNLVSTSIPYFSTFTLGQLLMSRGSTNYTHPLRSCPSSLEKRASISKQFKTTPAQK
jgi:hypothetical protein